MKAADYIAADPSLRAVADAQETVWINPRLLPFDTVDGLSQLAVSDADIADAAERLRRFAPFLRRAFPETEETDGLIESPLHTIPRSASRQSTMRRFRDASFSRWTVTSRLRAR